MAAEKKPSFTMQKFIERHKFKHKDFKINAALFEQGDTGHSIMYVKDGVIKLMAGNEYGKQVTLGLLGPGDFLGEECLGLEPTHATTAVAVSPVRILTIHKEHMVRLLQNKMFADHLLSYMISRNGQLKAELIERLLYPAEKRLARVLLTMSKSGKVESTHQKLAETIHAPRQRVSTLLAKFRRNGYIEYRSHRPGLRVNDSLMTVVRG